MGQIAKGQTTQTTQTIESCAMYYNVLQSSTMFYNKLQLPFAVAMAYIMLQ